ncbi:MAG: hypothetical protein Q8P67_26655 [archaeon]|nr:hypothetical protein [archaeon]
MEEPSPFLTVLFLLDISQSASLLPSPHVHKLLPPPRRLANHIQVFPARSETPLRPIPRSAPRHPVRAPMGRSEGLFPFLFLHLFFSIETSDLRSSLSFSTGSFLFHFFWGCMRLSLMYAFFVIVELA